MADYEPWSACIPAFEQLLDRINAYRKVVILSGDVHFGYTMTLGYEKPVGAVTGKAVQFVASAAKNATGQTIMLHLAGDLAQQLGMIRARTFSATRRSPGPAPALAAARGRSVLPYDDLADVLLGRVLRWGQETPAVFSRGGPGLRLDGVPAGSTRSSTITTRPPPRPAPAGCDEPRGCQRRLGRLGPGRADRHAARPARQRPAPYRARVGGQPQMARITFGTAAGLVTRQELFYAVGTQEQPDKVAVTDTQANLG